MNRELRDGLFILAVGVATFALIIAADLWL